MSDDVANFLAHRKAKKHGNGPKFKTFTASAAFMTNENGEGGAENGERAYTGSSGTFGASSKAVSNTLEKGEWVDDEPDVASSRLVATGAEMLDFEKLALEEKRLAEKAEQPKRSAYPVREPPPDFATSEKPATSWSAAAASRRAQSEFPALASASAAPAAANPPSVWGSRSAQISQPPAQQTSAPPAVATAKPAVDAPKAAETAEPAKPGVWRPKSHIAAASGSAPTSAAPSRPVGEAPIRPPSSTGSSDGLKKASEPWRPKNRMGGDS